MDLAAYLFGKGGVNQPVAGEGREPCEGSAHDHDIEMCSSFAEASEGLETLSAEAFGVGGSPSGFAPAWP